MWAVVLIPEFGEWLEESEHVAMNAFAKIAHKLLSDCLMRRVTHRRILQFYALEECSIPRIPSTPPILESH